MDNLSQGILSVLNSSDTVFLCIEPETIDFTKNEAFLLKIFGKKGVVEVQLNSNNLVSAIGIFKETLFCSGIKCIFWGAKNFFSTVLRYTKKTLVPECNLIDLKVIEYYLGIRQDVPKSYLEATFRARVIFDKQNQWKSVYKKIHLPLIWDVLPSVENTGIVDSQQRKLLRAYYEIEGTVNGRLKCHLAFKDGFNPHTIGPEQREIFLPYGEDANFMCFDFKFMEVTVLQWLSGDENLKKILDSGKDFYKVIFKLLSGVDCENDKYRNFAKKVFLPVVFGMTVKGMMEATKISEIKAQKILDTLNKYFPSAMSFVQRHQHETEISDYLGRVRRFEFNSCTKARNFVIQSPSATICCEKLIALRKTLHKVNVPIGFYVHDGYTLYVKKDKINYIKKLTKDVLEKPSELMPGLMLKTKCKIGPTLNSLVEE